MKVKDLIKKLQEYSKGDEDKEVYLVTDNDDGCETCGWVAQRMKRIIFK